MKNQKQFEQEVRDTYERMKKHKIPYLLNVDGIEITIFPNVFSPAYFKDSKWFAESVSEIVGKNKLLEVGTGTGIIALFSALKGAEVFVTDINKDAIENAKFNFKKHGLNLKAYEGDIYNPVPKREKFDFIFWNHPFNKGNNPNEEVLLKAGFDFGYEGLKKYISEASLHLKPDGRLLLGTGNFALLNEIEKIAKDNGYKMKLLKKIEDQLSEVPSYLKNDFRIYELIK